MKNEREKSERLQQELEVGRRRKRVKIGMDLFDMIAVFCFCRNQNQLPQVEEEEIWRAGLVMLRKG